MKAKAIWKDIYPITLLLIFLVLWGLVVLGDTARTVYPPLESNPLTGIDRDPESFESGRTLTSLNKNHNHQFSN